MNLLTSFLKYCVTGVASGGVDFGAYAALTHYGMYPLLANLISRTLGGIVCFLVNKYWTFRSRHLAHVWQELARFWTVFGVSFFAAEGLLALFYEVIGLEPLPAKVASELILVLMNFFVLRYWAFGRGRKEEETRV